MYRKRRDLFGFPFVSFVRFPIHHVTEHTERRPSYPSLLYKQECFSGKLSTRKVHTKLHPGLEWHIFHVLTSKDIDDVISRFYTVVCAKILLSM